jgi:hypothetical protein
MKIYSTVFWTQTGKVFSNFIRSIIWLDRTVSSYKVESC